MNNGKISKDSSINIYGDLQVINATLLKVLHLRIQLRKSFPVLLSCAYSAQVTDI